jgi:hypothetical protein
MSYAEKLQQFNSTAKYMSELVFLQRLIGNEQKVIMDFGCGINTALKFLNTRTSCVCLGYDKNKYLQHFDYCSPHEHVNIVYFMHSIAHIENIESVLMSLNTKTIIVITPNKSWIDENKNDFYKPDHSVIKHFTQDSLIELVEASGYAVAESGQFGKCINNKNERIFLIAHKK